jgi:hypothetical protein
LKLHLFSRHQFRFPGLADKLSPDLRIPFLILIHLLVSEREHGSNMVCTTVPSVSGSTLMLADWRMREDSHYNDNVANANAEPDGKSNSNSNWGDAHTNANTHANAHWNAGPISSIEADIGSGQPVHLWHSRFRKWTRSGGSNQH